MNNDIIKIIKFEDNEDNAKLINWLNNKTDANKFVIGLLTEKMQEETNPKPKNKKQRLRSLMDDDFWK